MGVGSSRGECSNTFLELLKQGATAQVVYTVAMPCSVDLEDRPLDSKCQQCVPCESCS